MSHVTELVDLTDDQLAEYNLKWVYDFGGRSLRYADRYDIIGALDDDLAAMFDDGASKDDIVLWLHEIATMFDDEDEANRQWRIQHPIIYAINRLGWHLSMVGNRQ
jgi:hypothetical protein